ncbi:hypothetical protein WJX82_007178 [Trebouxia sp. C0006]
MERLHSSEEDLFNLPQDDLAEAFGTPPTRNNSIKPLRKLSSKKSKKMEREGTQAQKDKQELMLTRRQNAKSQARKDARAFKELDTTLQVLGINGKQAAVEPTGNDLQASRKIQRAVSEASSEASEVSSRVAVVHPPKPLRVQSSQALNGPKAAPPRIASSPVLHDFASPPALAQGVLRDRSGEYSGHSDLSDLLNARQEWHAVLDDVLEGTHEDLEAIMSSASSKAQDLREQLIMWQTPPEGTWQARQQRLDWLGLAMSDAKEMFLGLRRHWNLLEHQNRVTDAVDIMKDVTQELSGMATLCCDAVAEGLRTVPAISLADLREGFNMQRTILHMVLKLHHRITTGLVTTNGPALGQSLGPPALEVVMAGFEATMRLQEAVLCPDCFACGLGGRSAHETNVRARQLQSCWEECQHATHAITSTWQNLRDEAHREWCQVYLKAAQLAQAMQTAVTPDQPSSRTGSPDAEMGISHGGGVWGRNPTSECCQTPSVSDEDLQAQAWFPGTLTVMLHLADQAATITLNESCLVEFEGEEYMTEAPAEAEELIDSMSTAFYSLAATGTVRVGCLCKAPQLLACWALELLEEQACHALMFVRDLDTSLLGQNEHGLEQFDTLRKCTDELVNAILHVRQLLKRRRFEAPDVPKPAGLRAARPGPSAKPSMPPRTSSSSTTGVRPSTPAHPSPAGPSRPPPAPSAKAAAALYRQQPSALTSRSSQLTASLKGSSVGTPSGRPPTGVASNGQVPRAAPPTAALRPANVVPQQARPMLSAHGFQPLPQQTADQSAQPSASQDSSAPAHPLDNTVGALTSQREQRAAQSAGQQSISTADATNGPAEPARASYASKVGIPVDPDSSTPVSTQGASRHRRSSPPAANGAIRLNGMNRQGQLPWDKAHAPTSPNTPLALPDSSEWSFKQSEALQSSGCSDSGFSLLWDDDPFWQLCWEEIKPTLVTKLGQGSFGQVYEGWYHSAPMAVKIINVDRCSGLNTRALQLFKDEVDLQRKLSFHPNIVRFIGACCQIPRQLIAEPTEQQQHPHLQAIETDMCGVTLAIVMELCRLGSFYKLIEQARRVAHLPLEVRTGARCPSTPEMAKTKASPGFRLYNQWSIRLELAHQAAAAVEFMHSHNVVHRDLTSNNLLVTDKWEAKVCDFNLARALKTDTVEPSATLNSPAWSAPERLQGKRYGKSADVFSFGVILWELITLGVPWRDMAEDGSVDDGRDNFYYVLNNVITGNHLPCPLTVEPILPELPQLVKVMEDCWNTEPDKRPTMAQVAHSMHSIAQAVKRRARTEHQSRITHTSPHV